MNIKNKITNISYHLVNKYSNLFDQNQLRVITIHNICEGEFSDLEKLIIDLKKNNWQFVTPTKFFDLKKNLSSVSGKNVLISFDDGYKSQYDFTNLVLEKYEIKAIFFVVNDFIFINEKNKKNFIMNKLFPNVKNLDTSKYENIKLFELKNLIDRDHIIGAHTRSHKKLSKIKHESELKDEIINAADELEEKLKYKIKNFAYTFGDIKSINKSSIELATKRFDYIFSGLRGNNIKNNKIVTREAVDFFSDLKLNHAILNGFYDFLYKKKLNKLEKWV